MTKFRIPALAALLLSGAFRPAFAAPDASGSVSVRAEAPVEAPAPTAGRSSMDREDIEESGADSLEAVLALLPGVSISGKGGSGAQASVSIRGSTCNQVLVVVDGIPVSDPSTGLADLSRLGLSPSDIESLEVIRGGASAQFGPDAVGGVIAIKTKRAPKDAGPVLDIGVSSTSRVPFARVSGSGFEARELPPDPLSLVDGQSASIALALPGGLSFSASGERARNAFAYHDGNGLRRVRENDSLLSGNGAVSWRRDGPGGRVDLQAAGAFRSIGVPGSVSMPTPESSERDCQLRVGGGYSTDSFFSDRLALEATAYATASGTEYRENGTDGADSGLASRAGIESRASLLAAGWLSIGATLTGRYERMDSDTVLDEAGGPPQRISAGAGLEPVMKFGPWTLAPAARFDYHSDFPSCLSFTLGSAWSPRTDAVLSLNAATAYRAPSFDDLYWPAGSGTEGNPDLRPEWSAGGDLGAKGKAGPFAFDASLYARYVKDVILWQPGDDGVWRSSNYGAAFYPGFGLEASTEAPWPLSAALSYSYLRSYLLSDGLGLADDFRVPMTPEHSFDFRLSYAAGLFRAGAEFSYTGLRYFKMANVAYSPAYLVVNLRARFGLGGEASIDLDAENLLDERYESVQGYPMPGFSLRIGYRTRFGGKASGKGGEPAKAGDSGTATEGRGGRLGD